MGSRFEETQRKINEFLGLYPDAEWGFAHIVLSDYNLEDEWIHEVLQTPVGNDTVLHTATVEFLNSLLVIPEDERVPDRGYDEA